MNTAITPAAYASCLAQLTAPSTSQVKHWMLMLANVSMSLTTSRSVEAKHFVIELNQ